MEMKKRCELCKSKAGIYCESDKASLCWGCDARVHSANFLVARHSRYLLCGFCQSPTPWAAAGAVLSPTFSVCEKCVDRNRRAAGEDNGGGNEVVLGNQIAPPPGPLPESRSCSVDVVSSRKRRILNVSDFASNKDDQECSSSKLNGGTSPPESVAVAVAVACVRPGEEMEQALQLSKAAAPQEKQRMTSFEVGISESGILEGLRRFHREELGRGLEMAECCTLSKDGPEGVDLSSCDSS